MMAAAFRRDAHEILDRELRRRRGAFVRLPSERRIAVDELVTCVVEAAVDGVLEHARNDARVAAALESIYGTRSVLAPAPGTPD